WEDEMIEQKIMEDYKDAMKSRNAVKSTVLSSLRAQFKYDALAKKKDVLDDGECLAVIKRIIKQHLDSIDQFTKGNRTDLAEKEQLELVILKAYLPEEMPAEEIKKIIEEAVAATGAQGMKDMGKVMKEVKAKTGDRADGKLVSDLVKEKLSTP
ncbi:MAG: GatB/YqeY domain-containing protein, partial [Candidatus Omnitrophica bacterium]|nr:GatB/YqeY domain-containing protein [Candidatus Omnitrophota bacterium]